jgi:hypothetical protein
MQGRQDAEKIENILAAQVIDAAIEKASCVRKVSSKVGLGLRSSRASIDAQGFCITVAQNQFLK